MKTGPLGGFFRRESAWDRVRRPVVKAASSPMARSGLAAGATVVVLSVASAMTSAVRRREEGR